MRTLAIFLIFFFGFGAVLVAQPPGGQGQGGQRQIVITQSDGTQRTVTVPERSGAQIQVQAQPGGQMGGPQGQRGGPQGQMGGPQGQRGGPQGQMGSLQGQGGGFQGQGGGFQGQGQRGGGQTQGAQFAPPARPGQPPVAQGNQPLRAAQPGAMNANQVTQAMTRLRAMDANQNGILEANEIPADRRDRVNTWVTELGGNPNAPTFNLAALERRAMTVAGGNPQQTQQPNQQQQQQPGGDRQQRQQQQATPLVPPFGERVTTEAAPLVFGQRNRVAQTFSQARGGGQRGGNNQRGATIPPPITPKISAPYDNIPANLRSNRNFSWFFEFDTDQDGQITMAEYVNGIGGTWTEGIAAEFVGYTREDESIDPGLDRNGDGFATIEEVLSTIKDRDEWSALQAGTRQAAEPPTRQSGRPGQGEGRPGQSDGRYGQNSSANTNDRPQRGTMQSGQGRQQSATMPQQGQGRGQGEGRGQGGGQQGGQQMGPGGRGGPQPGAGGVRGGRGGGGGGGGG